MKRKSQRALRQRKQSAARRRRATRRRNRSIPAATASTKAIVNVQPPEKSVELVSAIPNVSAAVENLETVRRFISKCLNIDLQCRLAKLKDGQQLEQSQREKLEIDWGTIPGIDKPFLKQPGAEKFVFWLGLRPEYTKREIELPGGHLEMVCSVTMYSKKTKEKIFDGPDCSCSTMESNYRFRWAERNSMPSHDEAEKLKAQGLGKFKKKAVLAHGKKVKDEWVWFDRAENPNIHDERNKVRQIGEKRALVKCVRNMGALSEIFTSDPSEWAFAELEEPGSPYDDLDFTPSGRQVFINGKSPSGKRVSEEAELQQAKKAAEKIAQEKIAKAQGQKIVRVAFKEKGLTHVTGDIGSIVHRIEQECAGKWDAQLRVWIVPGSHAHVLHAICQELGYDFVEDSGLPSPQKQPEMAQTEKPRTPSATGVSKPVPQAGAGLGYPPTGMNPPSQPAPADNRIVRVKSADSKGKQYLSEKGSPYIQVLWRGVWLPCFDQRLFQFLEAGIGKDAELIVNKKHVIVGLKRVGDRSFDDDGRTPQIDVNEPRGQSLF